MALMSCRACGNQISENASMCPQCGEPYSPGPFVRGYHVSCACKACQGIGLKYYYAEYDGPEEKCPECRGDGTIARWYSRPRELCNQCFGHGYLGRDKIVRVKNTFFGYWEKKAFELYACPKCLGEGNYPAGGDS